MDRYQFLLSMMSIMVGGGTVITLIVTAGKLIMRRRESGVLHQGAAARIDDRLLRIEQAIDAMSVEVERISENQRFATRLLSERSGERAGT